jgi:hypothetical protein
MCGKIKEEDGDDPLSEGVVLSRALEGTRTPGLQVRNLSLYPLSYERMEQF